MTALLNLAVTRFMQRQMEAKIADMNLKTNTLTLPSSHTGFTKATKQGSLAFDSGSFLSSDSANTVGNPNPAAAILTHQRVNLQAADNTTHGGIVYLPYASPKRGTWAGVGSLGQVAERGNSPT